MGIAWGAFPIVGAAAQAHREKRDVITAAARATVETQWPLVVAMGIRAPLYGPAVVGLSLLGTVPDLAGAAHGLIRARNVGISEARRPFSHRFEHTQASFEAQQRGLQSIYGARSMIGAEAGAFAQRYARR